MTTTLPPTTPATVAHDSTDCEAEAEYLYRERTKLATDEYQLADIEAALLYETEGR